MGNRLVNAEIKSRGNLLKRLFFLLIELIIATSPPFLSLYIYKVFHISIAKKFQERKKG